MSKIPASITPEILQAIDAQWRTHNMAGSLLGVRVYESRYLTEPQPYVIRRTIPRRGISRRIKATRQVPMQGALICNNEALIMHPDILNALLHQENPPVVIVNLATKIISHLVTHRDQDFQDFLAGHP